MKQRETRRKIKTLKAIIQTMMPTYFRPDDDDGDEMEGFVGCLLERIKEGDPVAVAIGSELTDDEIASGFGWEQHAYESVEAEMTQTPIIRYLSREMASFVEICLTVNFAIDVVHELARAHSGEMPDANRWVEVAEGMICAGAEEALGRGGEQQTVSAIERLPESWQIYASGELEQLREILEAEDVPRKRSKRTKVVGVGDLPQPWQKRASQLMGAREKPLEEIQESKFFRSQTWINSVLLNLKMDHGGSDEENVTMLAERLGVERHKVEEWVSGEDVPAAIANKLTESPMPALAVEPTQAGDEWIVRDEFDLVDGAKRRYVMHTRPPGFGSLEREPPPSQVGRGGAGFNDCGMTNHRRIPHSGPDTVVAPVR